MFLFVGSEWIFLTCIENPVRRIEVATNAYVNLKWSQNGSEQTNGNAGSVFSQAKYKVQLE